jgi:hypothetical protein
MFSISSSSVLDLCFALFNLHAQVRRAQFPKIVGALLHEDSQLSEELTLFLEACMCYFPSISSFRCFSIFSRSVLDLCFALFSLHAQIWRVQFPKIVGVLLPKDSQLSEGHRSLAGCTLFFAWFIHACNVH